MKWMENEFSAIDNILSWQKNHFHFISQENIYFFSLGKKKICLDKKYFVQADGQGTQRYFGKNFGLLLLWI